MTDQTKKPKMVTRGDTFDYSLIDVNHVKQHFESGLDLPDLLKHYGINRVTFYRATVERPEIREAWNVGRLAFIASLDSVMMSIVLDNDAKPSDRINAYNAYLKYSVVPKQREREEARLEAESLTNEELIDKINHLSNDPLRARLSELESFSPIAPEPSVETVSVSAQDSDDWNPI